MSCRACGCLHGVCVCGVYGVCVWGVCTVHVCGLCARCTIAYCAWYLHPSWQTPIDEIDAAARVLDPVFSGVGDPSKRAFGVFYKVCTHGYTGIAMGRMVCWWLVCLLRDVHSALTRANLAACALAVAITSPASCVCMCVCVCACVCVCSQDYFVSEW